MKIIVIGASAGGVRAMQGLVAPLPQDLDAAIFVVVHTGAEGPRLMAQILSGAGDLPASYPADGEKFERGRIYIAPPDHHLLVEAERVRVVRGPKENRYRPAVDPLFRSAAVHHGVNVIGVILTGYLNDGTVGLMAVKEAGGVAVVQEPSEAAAPDMPENALRVVDVDHCVPLVEMPLLLERLTSEKSEERREAMAVSKRTRLEAEGAALKPQLPQAMGDLGTASGLTCPDCGGALWEVEDPKMLRYRCHLGHALTAEALTVAQHESVDNALWLALRTLQETAAAALQMGERARKLGDDFAVRLFEVRREQATAHAAAVREMLLSMKTASAGLMSPPERYPQPELGATASTASTINGYG